MPFQLDPDLPTPLLPLAWLVGVWAGAGVVGYPSMDEDLRFGQEVEFSHDGRPFLSYRSRTWLLDDAGERVRPLATETGYWRVNPGGGAPTDGTQTSGTAANGTATNGSATNGAPAGTGGSAELEVLLVHPTGFVEIYLGSVQGPRIRLHTDLVARTSTAKEYSAATRMYGLVEGDLLWVLEMAAMGRPLEAHASARLKRL